MVRKILLYEIGILIHGGVVKHQIVTCECGNWPPKNMQESNTYLIVFSLKKKTAIQFIN